MHLHADLSKRAVITHKQYQWVASPQAGVERMMLDRIGAEKARATSIVTYAPDSFFPAHQHPGGEEILVLSGTFSDQSGDYPEGTYVRNPPGSEHKPYSVEGAKILVKLWQMPSTEGRQVVVNTHNPEHWETIAGGEVCHLFNADYEQVSMQRLHGQRSVMGIEQGGAEFFVLAGELLNEGEVFGPGSWLRLPHDPALKVSTGDKGATFYLKTGHLPAASAE
ncbi:MAG: cupin domain-containing protein [Idiomarina sp.]|nr:cupin domain-containing protein [Idiomarina sp.]